MLVTALFDCSVLTFEKDLTWLITTYLLMNLKTLMSIQLSYGGLDPFLRIGSSALELVGALHRGKWPVVVFRRERNLDLS